MNLLPLLTPVGPETPIHSGSVGEFLRASRSTGRSLSEPQPLFHATLALPVAGMPDGWTARALFLRKPDGGIELYGQLVEYMKAHPFRSGTWQNDVTRAVGLFWDYCQACGDGIMASATAMKIDPHRALFRAFGLALVSGTLVEGGDKTGLQWPRTGVGRSRTLVRSIENFARWCDGEGSRSSLAVEMPRSAPGSALSVTELLVWSRVRNVSMLRHISAPKDLRRPGIVDFGSSARGTNAEPVKFFPSDQLERLLWEGHARPGRELEQNPFLRFNVRDQLITLLDAWGGLRRSEGLHLWVQDVTAEAKKPGHALVVLNHPSEAIVDYIDPVTRRSARATRQHVLERLYGLRPRQLQTRGRYHVGWKSLELNKDHQAFVFWLDETAGALFWVLYHGYLRYVRRPIMDQRRRRGGFDHPFLFVSEGEANDDSGALIGDPYSNRSYERNHAAAVRRIGLPHSKNDGTTTHGLRHSYGQTLTLLGVSPGVVKKGLHHRQFLSQVPYTIPSNSRVNEVLQAAGRGETLPIEPLGHESAGALRRLHDYITGGENLG